MRWRGAVAALACLAAVSGGAARGAQGDPLVGEQYALTQLRAPQAWARTQGRGAVVAVVDTGVDLGHPDFRGRLVPGITFLACGARGCGKGDWRSGPAGRRSQAFGHGTSVAGVIVAGRGNGAGIVGVAPLAKVMPVKIGDKGDVTEIDVARGIRWAADHGADVINLSLALVDGVVSDAVRYAAGRGVVVVGAAGNSSMPTCVTPGALPEAICVTATDRTETPALYTSTGVKENLRSVAAPGGAGAPAGQGNLPLPECGERIVSTWPRGDTGAGRCPASGGYRWLYGTSLAAPHVAGVAALLAAQGRSAADIVEVLVATARTPGVGVTGTWTPHYGHGIVDAAAAVAAPR